MKSVKQSFKLITLSRPYSWIKNLFIFIPLFFAKDLFVDHKFIKVTLAFVVFCITASSVYIINDIFDKEQDQKHDLKKDRPLASGAVSTTTAILTFVGLLIIDIVIIYFFIPQIAWLVGLYFILNILYSGYLKHIPVLDLLMVSSFYFIRIMVGGIAADVLISHWLLICIIFISLFLIVGKRLAEFNRDEKRTVLLQYSRNFLNKTLIVLAFLVVIFYTLYSLFVLKSNFEIFSIFLVAMGIMRYLFLAFTTHRAEYPEKILITDKILFSIIFVWILVIYFIIYLHV
ncbi:MAG: UbiA prenyltransferase family protein [Candidatus Pacebacteria bacterium]|nr:UbiA prenyltransferase family protein [Candidatus Paceibacterota bacterium]